jgi:precorrin-6A/cobalt-precorrin-6A reductase
MTILILGGTAEARVLAAELAGAGRDVLTCLAGRVREPAMPAGRVRVGGFGGAQGLAAFLRTSGIWAMVDATHPFAARIGASAATAAALVGVPLLRLERPGWTDHPRSADWTWVPDAAAARTAAQAHSRPFLTTGRQSLPEFLAWADRSVLVRVVDPPDLTLPERWTVFTARGPYDYAAERRLMAEFAVDVLLTKDSGGSHTVAKLDAAGDLGIPVVIIARPVRPSGLATAATVAAALAWPGLLPDPARNPSRASVMARASTTARPEATGSAARSPEAGRC